MKQTIDKGSWVQIYRVVLPAGERAPQLPDDTRRVPLEMRVKGRLVAPARLGDEVEIVGIRDGQRFTTTVIATERSGYVQP